MNPPTPTLNKGLKVWQLALTIVAVALIIRVGLGALPVPDNEPANHQPVQPRSALLTDPNADQVDAQAQDDFSAIEVLPFNLKGEVPGPLLTSILQRYLPNSTPDHADALRDTLPPGQDPRMIVIIPDEDEQLF